MELRAAEQRTHRQEISRWGNGFEVLNLKESRGKMIKDECGFN